jgi:hypothetical protein
MTEVSFDETEVGDVIATDNFISSTQKTNTRQFWEQTTTSIGIFIEYLVTEKFQLSRKLFASTRR